MTTDVVERLRDAASDLAVEAADEIERLKAQLARTETALDNEFNNGIALCAEIDRLQKLVGMIDAASNS